MDDCAKCPMAINLILTSTKFKLIFCIVFVFPLGRHALVWTCCSSHIFGKEDREAACLCEHAEQMPSLNLIQSLPTSRLSEIISLFFQVAPVAVTLSWHSNANQSGVQWKLEFRSAFYFLAGGGCSQGHSQRRQRPRFQRKNLRSSGVGAQWVTSKI